MNVYIHSPGFMQLCGFISLLIKLKIYRIVPSIFLQSFVKLIHVKLIKRDEL